MKVTLIWLLIAASSGNNTSPTVIERFTERNECQRAATQIYNETRDTRAIAYLYGICVAVDPAKLAKKD